jgi:cell division protein FtsW
MAAISQASRTQLAGARVAANAARLRRGTPWVGLDGWILVSVLALTCLGLLMVYSASISQAWVQGSSTVYLKKEGLFIVFGLMAMMVGATVRYTTWKRFSTPIAAVSVLLLVAVLVPHVGTTSNGAQRWFGFGSFQIEPSEIAKVGMAIYFAHWLSKKGDKMRSLGACTVPFGVMLGLVCILVLKQPDMGTAVVIATAMIAVYFVAGARLDHLAAGILAGFGAALVGVRMDAYRGARFAVWLDPWKYSKGAGFQAVQVLIALGRGGLLGVGPGNSQQKYILPAPFTDSIFAVTGEELGFIGAISVVGLFVLLAYRGFRVANHAPDAFGKLLAAGITATIAIQAFVNIAVITASIPFTGVPLPFISYGGSSLVVCLFGAGVLLNISLQSGTRGGPVHEPNIRLKRDSRLEGPAKDANSRNRRQDGRSRVSGPGRRGVSAPALGSPGAGVRRGQQSEGGRLARDSNGKTLPGRRTSPTRARGYS